MSDDSLKLSGRTLPIPPAGNKSPEVSNLPTPQAGKIGASPESPRQHHHGTHSSPNSTDSHNSHHHHHNSNSGVFAGPLQNETTLDSSALATNFDLPTEEPEHHHHRRKHSIHKPKKDVEDQTFTQIPDDITTNKPNRFAKKAQRAEEEDPRIDSDSSDEMPIKEVKPAKAKANQNYESSTFELTSEAEVKAQISPVKFESHSPFANKLKQKSEKPTAKEILSKYSSTGNEQIDPALFPQIGKNSPYNISQQKAEEEVNEAKNLNNEQIQTPTKEQKSVEEVKTDSKTEAKGEKVTKESKEAENENKNADEGAAEEEIEAEEEVAEEEFIEVEEEEAANEEEAVNEEEVVDEEEAVNEEEVADEEEAVNEEEVADEEEAVDEEEVANEEGAVDGEAEEETATTNENAEEDATTNGETEEEVIEATEEETATTNEAAEEETEENGTADDEIDKDDGEQENSTN